MRSIENSGLGTTTPVLAHPGRAPAVSRMLYTGDRHCAGPAPTRVSDFFRRSIGLQTCDADGSGSVGCQLATPVSALSGLGGTTVTNPFCSGFDQALENLNILLTEAERISAAASYNLTDSVAYQQAKAYYAKESSWWAWNRTDPVIPSTCTKAILTAESYYAALNAEVKAGGGKQGVDLPAPALPGTDTDHSLANAIKWVAIAGGITVAVGGVIYLVGPFVRSLAKAGARAVR